MAQSKKQPEAEVETTEAPEAEAKTEAQTKPSGAQASLKEANKMFLKQMRADMKKRAAEGYYDGKRRR